MADHPDWWSLLLSGAAWLAMPGRDSMSRMSALCRAWAPDATDDVVGTMFTAWHSGALRPMLLGWAAMTLAMVPPLAVPLIRHVAVRTFADRRNREIAAFLAGAVAVWLLLGLLALPLLALPLLAGLTMQWIGDPMVAACGFLLAALWQLTPMKRLALLRCHRTFPLTPRGWRADRDCAGYGVAHGRDCVASCWAMMFAAMFAAHGPVVMLCVQYIALTERQARQPRVRLSALVLAICAALMLVQPPV